MNKTIFVLAAFGAAITAHAAEPISGEEGWVTLFGGTSLDNWQMGPDRSWVVENGVITLRREFDGKEHKFPRAIKDFARRGYIGLQDHGRPVWYRNIRIKPAD